MKCKQVELSQKTKHIVCWVDTPERIKQGYSITLKGIDGLWFLDKINEVTVQKSESIWQLGGV